MIAHPQGCDVILKKADRLFQMLMSHIGKIAGLIIAVSSPDNNSHNNLIMAY